MNYNYQVMAIRSIDNMQQIHGEDLQEQVRTLTEWKNKVMIQLEYFKTACRMYNLCDVREVNALLTN